MTNDSHDTFRADAQSDIDERFYEGVIASGHVEELNQLTDDNYRAADFIGVDDEGSDALRAEVEIVRDCISDLDIDIIETRRFEDWVVSIIHVDGVIQKDNKEQLHENIRSPSGSQQETKDKLRGTFYEFLRPLVHDEEQIHSTFFTALSISNGKINAWSINSGQGNLNELGILTFCESGHLIFPGMTCGHPDHFTKSEIDPVDPSFGE